MRFTNISEITNPIRIHPKKFLQGMPKNPACSISMPLGLQLIDKNIKRYQRQSGKYCFKTCTPNEAQSKETRKRIYIKYPSNSNFHWYALPITILLRKYPEVRLYEYETPKRYEVFRLISSKLLRLFQ